MILTDQQLAEISERIVKDWKIPRNWLEAMVEMCRLHNYNQRQLLAKPVETANWGPLGGVPAHTPPPPNKPTP
jgi:hypothetical protein